MKAPNSIFADMFNKLTYKSTVTNASLKPNKWVNKLDMEPIWICGMFRSGTSLTTQIVSELGIDIGPENDLLQPKGHRAKLNPNGFFENFLMMDFSSHTFNLLDAWGDNPPAIDAVKKLDIHNIDYKSFVYDSIVNFHDDRISNANKKRILKTYYPGNIEQYLKDNFNPRFAIKNPHFSLLYPLLNNICKRGEFLVVFRNPTDTINSAKQVTPNANEELYCSYYEGLMSLDNAFFFDFDELRNNPQKSIELLAKHLKIESINPEINKIVTQKTSTELLSPEISEKVKNLYLNLKLKAINRP